MNKKKGKDQAYDAQGNHMGFFDGKYLYDLRYKMLLRVDGDEVYTLEIPTEYIGTFERSVAKRLDGTVIFRVTD